MLPLKEERLLVKKAKGGCQDAFTELVIDCCDKLRGSLFQKLKNEDLVSEVFQITLVKSWKKIKTFTGLAQTYATTSLERRSVTGLLLLRLFRKKTHILKVYLSQVKSSITHQGI